MLAVQQIAKPFCVTAFTLVCHWETFCALQIVHTTLYKHVTASSNPKIQNSKITIKALTINLKINV